MDQVLMLVLFDELIENTKKVEENLILYHKFK